MSEAGERLIKSATEARGAAKGEMIELKPCPITGDANPRLVELIEGNKIVAQGDHIGVTVHSLLTEEETIKAWNTRAAPKVKPLEFTDSKAEGCNIIYNIKKWPNSKKYRVMFNRFGGIDWLNDEFDSWHDARVGAQSHYEKLILEALE